MFNKKLYFLCIIRIPLILGQCLIHEDRGVAYQVLREDVFFLPFFCNTLKNLQIEEKFPSKGRLITLIGCKGVLEVTTHHG